MKLLRCFKKRRRLHVLKAGSIAERDASLRASEGKFPFTGKDMDLAFNLMFMHYSTEKAIRKIKSL